MNSERAYAYRPLGEAIGGLAAVAGDRDSDAALEEAIAGVLKALAASDDGGVGYALMEARQARLNAQRARRERAEQEAMAVRFRSRTTVRST